MTTKTQLVKVTVDDTELRRLLSKLEKQGNPVRIVADGVEYGVFVEYGFHHRGGSYIAARPAGGNAVESIRGALEKALAQAKSLERTEAALDKLAHDLEAAWKQGITEMDAVDTGAYRASIHVVSGTETEMFAAIGPDGKLQFTSWAKGLYKARGGE
jgi:hypothetical protein